MLEEYVSRLRRILGTSLDSEHADEVASEVENHLSERTEELKATGLSPNEAERQAEEEFGHVCEMADELASAYPPKLPVRVGWLKYLPAGAIVVLLSASAYSYSLFGGTRGLEAAAQCLIPTTPMLIIPGMTTGMAQVKYRRLKQLSFQRQMADCGLAVCLVATICLADLQWKGLATTRGLYPMYYTFSGASILMYLAMQAAFVHAKHFRSVR